MTALYAPVIPERRSKPVPRKCSTCGERKCRVRGSVCDWLHCGRWKPKSIGNQEGGTKRDQH